MTKFQKVILIVLAAIALLLIVVAVILPKEQPVADEPTQATPAPTIEVVELKLVPVITPVPEPLPPLPGSTEEKEQSSSTTPVAESSRMPAEPTVEEGTAFTLTVARSNISVAYGVDEETLEQMPGWLTTSAKPGSDGVCVIYGHRNRKHLLVLKNVDFGDPITITTPDGQAYTYTVESIEILESDKDLNIPTLSGQHLMITTCYPFHYTGHAPKKYVVIASR